MAQITHGSTLKKAAGRLPAENSPQVYLKATSNVTLGRGWLASRLHKQEGAKRSKQGFKDLPQGEQTQAKLPIKRLITGRKQASN